MGFVMTEEDGFFVPVAVCDHCGREAGPESLVLWDMAASLTFGAERRMLVACEDECLEALAGGADDPEGERADERDWVAVALDAYLAGLVERLAIDPAAVLERERAAAAAEETRREGPE